MRTLFALFLLSVSLVPVAAAEIEQNPVDVDVELSSQERGGASGVDLYLGKRLVGHSESTIEKGDFVTVELVYRNEGDKPATNIVIEDYYGRERFLNIIDPPEQCVDDMQKLVCSLGTLAAGAEGTLRYQARVAFTSENGERSTFSTISAQETETDTRNNVARIVLTVLPEPSRQAKIVNGSSAPTTPADFDPSPSRTPVSSPNKAAEASVSPTTTIGTNEKNSLQAEFFADTQVLFAEEESSLILSIANRSRLVQTDLKATVTFPFAELDLLSTNQAYAFHADADKLVFTRPSLTPGERWVIRFAVRSGADSYSNTRLRATVTGSLGETELEQAAEISLVQGMQKPQSESPELQKYYVQLPQKTAGAGTPMTGILLGSVLFALLIGLNRRFIHR